MTGHYEVIFRGEIYAAVDPVKARSDMAKLFRQPAEKVHRLFDGRTWVLKDGLDKPTAERYQVELAKIGVISELRDKTPKFDARKAPPKEATQDFTLGSIGITRMTCPDCAYEQLEADYCARCGVSINLARARAKLRETERETDEITSRIRALRHPDGPPPERLRVEDTREFHGVTRRGPSPLLWSLATVGFVAAVIGALILTGVLQVNL